MLWLSGLIGAITGAIVTLLYFNIGSKKQNGNRNVSSEKQAIKPILIFLSILLVIIIFVCLFILLSNKSSIS
jgi:NADH:ubiquinone oxidoreductase subunit 6 (subunit J)